MQILDWLTSLIPAPIHEVPEEPMAPSHPSPLQKNISALADLVHVKVAHFFEREFTTSFIKKAHLFHVDISALETKIGRLEARCRHIDKELGQDLPKSERKLRTLEEHLLLALKRIDQMSLCLFPLKNELHLKEQAAKKYHHTALKRASQGIIAASISPAFIA